LAYDTVITIIGDMSP